MTTIEEQTKRIDKLYTEATTKEQYHRVWQFAKYLEMDIQAKSGILVRWAAREILNGFWARYYELLKFNGVENEIDDLYSRVANYYYGLELKEDLDVKIAYGYLLSVILSHLKKDSEQAGKVDKEIIGLAEESGEIVSVLRSITAQGLTPMKKEYYYEAIAVFDKGWKLFPEHKHNPETFRHFGNISNNRGFSKIHLSGRVKNRVERIVYLNQGISDITLAVTIYTSEKVPPLKHLKGIGQHRLRLAIWNSCKVFSLHSFLGAWREIRRVNKLLKKLPKE